MSPIITPALFGLIVGTLIVPVGAQIVGRLIQIFGDALQRHGEYLGEAGKLYLRRWRER